MNVPACPYARANVFAHTDVMDTWTITPMQVMKCKGQQHNL